MAVLVGQPSVPILITARHLQVRGGRCWAREELSRWLCCWRWAPPGCISAQATCAPGALLTWRSARPASCTPWRGPAGRPGPAWPSRRARQAAPTPRTRVHTATVTMGACRGAERGVPDARRGGARDQHPTPRPPHLQARVHLDARVDTLGLRARGVHTHTRGPARAGHAGKSPALAPSRGWPTAYAPAARRRTGARRPPFGRASRQT